jgi:hypothetical protein
MLLTRSVFIERTYTNEVCADVGFYLRDLLFSRENEPCPVVSVQTDNGSLFNGSNPIPLISG